MSKNEVMLNVWIHSNPETGKPDSVDVLEIDGHIDMNWFCYVFYDNNDESLAEQFYEHLKSVDNSAWFHVKHHTEDAPESRIEVLGLVAEV